MFPKQKTTVKKEMQILQVIVGEDGDIDDVFKPLFGTVKRIVVKRPKTAKWLCQQEPDVCFQGKKCRFDVYIRI